ncbi:hypothetical protein DNTS_000437, partial [Danionella cerebrum]
QVVGQIDRLTSDLELDVDLDDWTLATASSESSSERGLSEPFSDSWDFCGFLEPLRTQTQRCNNHETCLISSISQHSEETEKGLLKPAQMNGGLPLPNGPLVVTPDSSSEEASSSTHSQKNSRMPRERVRFSDKILYHALCCDDDDEEEEDKGECGTPDTDSPLASSPIPPLSSSVLYGFRETASAGSSPVKQPVLGSHTLPRKNLQNPSSRKKLLRNSSTQTVSDKSTQTVLPYVSKLKNKAL